MKVKLLIVLALCVNFPLFAIREKDGNPWDVNFVTKNEYELKVQAKYPKGSFLLNLGPTGIRAKIESTDPDKLRGEKKLEWSNYGTFTTH